MSKPPDENERAIAGTLPNDPSADTVPMDDGPPPPGDEHAPGQWGEVGGGAPAHAADEAKRAAEREAARTARLEGMHVRTAGRALLRLYTGEVRRDYIPWPGTDPAWPAAGPTIAAGELRTASPEVRRARGESWAPLWRIAGPLFPDRLTVLVGPTGRGKSGFAVQVAEAAAVVGVPVLYASAEMGTDDVIARLIALRAVGGADPDAGPAHSSIVVGNADPNDVADAVEALVADCPHLYVWAPTGNQRTPAALAEAVADVVAATKRAPLVIVDYLQRFTGGGEDARMVVKDASGGLRDLSRPGGMPEGCAGIPWPGCAMLVLSSTARGHYERFATVDALADAYSAGELVGTGKESGEIEYDAPLLLALTADVEGDGAARRAMVAVVKDRHLRTGRVALRFAAAPGRFRTLTPAEAEAEASAGADRDVSRVLAALPKSPRAEMLDTLFDRLRPMLEKARERERERKGRGGPPDTGSPSGPGAGGGGSRDARTERERARGGR